MNNENNENVCYVPQGVKAKSDIIPNMGKRELLRMGVCILADFVVLAIVYAISKSVSTAIIAFSSLAAIAYGVNIKDPLSGFTVVDEAQNFIRFKKMQKLYLYDYLPEKDFL